MNALLHRVLNATESRFEAIFNAEPECVKVLDRNGRILQMNPAGLCILQAQSSSEVIGRDMFDFIPESHINLVRDCFIKALRRQEVTCSFEVIDLRGVRHWMESHMVAMGSDEPNEVLAVTRDVSQSRRYEEALRESEERFRLIVENCSDLVAELTLDGRFLYANPAFQAALGHDPDTLVQSRLNDFMHDDDVDGVAKLLAGAAVTTTFRFRNANGAWRWLEGSGRRYRESSQAERVALIARDITQRVEAEQAQTQIELRLQRAQRMEALGTLAGGIAHDFNNILAAIIGNIELARLTVPTDNPGAEPLNEVLRAAMRATDLVRQILTFSRQKEHERRVIQITPIVFEAIRLLRAGIPSSIEIQTIVPRGLPNVLADPSQIHQIVMNLGANAAHAMRNEGGILEVALSAMTVSEAMARGSVGLNPGNYLRLVVRDTGDGIPPKVLERMFEPFFTTKPAGEGTGLGLSVVHGIVKAHDGAIAVTSEVGKGTSFEVFIPAVEDPTITGATANHESPHGDGELILYVDDEIALCKLVETTLTRCGYRAITRSDPVEALRIFIEDPSKFTAVITDFTMPRMSGLDLIAQIKTVEPSIPAILTTGFTSNLDVPALTAAGVQEVLAKPFTMQRLAECLHRVLAARKNSLQQ